MTEPTTKGAAERPTVTFHYLKATDFRTVHADGAIGGITPQGSLHASFWAQRPAIPRLVTQPVSPDGKLGEPVDKQGREGIVRELQVDVMLSLSAAKEVHEWLGERIQQLEERLQVEKARSNQGKQE